MTAIGVILDQNLTPAFWYTSNDGEIFSANEELMQRFLDNTGRIVDFAIHHATNLDANSYIGDIDGMNLAEANLPYTPRWWICTNLNARPVEAGVFGDEVDEATPPTWLTALRDLGNT